MKVEVRKDALHSRERIPTSEREKLNKIIFDYISTWDLYRKSGCVMLYASFRSEVDTWSLIDHSLKNGKRVVLPKTIREGTRILPCIINSVDELEKTPFGVMEPKTGILYDISRIDLALIPGAAFDLDGGRIGYGAGYYDRFLEGYKGVKTGVCFSSQIVENTFCLEYDVKMDYLITDRGIINTGDKR